MPAMMDNATDITEAGASKRPHEFRNLMCLAVIYGTYFISTQGCMQVFQLASQFLRDDEEVGENKLFITKTFSGSKSLFEIVSNAIRTWFSKGKNRIDVGKTKMCSKFWTLVSKFRV